MREQRIATVHFGYSGERFFLQLKKQGVKLIFQSIPFFQQKIWQSTPDLASNYVQRIEIPSYFLSKVQNRKVNGGGECISSNLYNIFKNDILNNLQLSHLFDRGIQSSLSLGDRVALCYSLYVEMIAFLENQDISIIFYGVYPHHPWDHLFRLTARALGIKQFFCISSVAAGNYCFINDDSDCPISSKVLSSGQSSKILDEPINEHARSIWKSQLLSLSPAPWQSSLRHDIQEIDLLSLYGKRINQIANIDFLYIKNCSKSFGQLTPPAICDQTGIQKIVVFYLHFEPEAATNPLGGSYWEQRVAILRLRQLLPDSWLLVLKDHPQLALSPVNYGKYRGSNFFDSLRGLPNTLYIDPFQSITSDSLILASMLSVTLCGTVILQSLFLKVPVLKLGIFPSLPGVLDDFPVNLEQKIISLYLELKKVSYESILAAQQDYLWPINPYGEESELIDNSGSIHETHEKQCALSIVKLARMIDDKQ
jgi:hypothetical protein